MRQWLADIHLTEIDRLEVDQLLQQWAMLDEQLQDVDENIGQAVVKVLRFDVEMRNWYKRIKRRRGSKIARVAVMRRSATVIWRMLK